MVTQKDIEAREAKHGEKMIEVKVRFWTDNIAEEPGKILPKHAWPGGVVRMERNEPHGIKPQKPVIFNSLMDLPFAIEKVLVNHDIILHLGGRMKKYFQVE